MGRNLTCHHCKTQQPVESYTAHVKDCIAYKSATWDVYDYSANYYKQARALSKFKQPGDTKVRNKFKSWAWYVKRQGTT